MKTKYILIICLCLVLLGASAILYKKNLIYNPTSDTTKLSEDVIVKNQKYYFEFSYPKSRKLFNIDEWDNGLPGSEDGGVYGYRASGDNMGPYTDQIYLSIYNTSLEKYLSRYGSKVANWRIEDIDKFGKKGKKMTNAGATNNLGTGGTTFCEIIFEQRGLLYTIDCTILYFKFYN